MTRDLRTLARFVTFYCNHVHPDAPRSPTRLRAIDVERICGRPVLLCKACGKLLAHAFVKRVQCPLDPKPACKKCPQHCYAPSYRAQIQEVMRFSGPRLLLRGRLDYLLHLL
jgi:hypothetical protein